MAVQMKTNLVPFKSESSISWKISNLEAAKGIILRSEKVKIPQEDPSRSVYWHLELKPGFDMGFYSLDARFCLTGDSAGENGKFRCHFTDPNMGTYLITEKRKQRVSSGNTKDEIDLKATLYYETIDTKCELIEEKKVEIPKIIEPMPVRGEEAPMPLSKIFNFMNSVKQNDNGSATNNLKIESDDDYDHLNDAENRVRSSEIKDMKTLKEIEDPLIPSHMKRM